MITFNARALFSFTTIAALLGAITAWGLNDVSLAYWLLGFTCGSGLAGLLWDRAQ